MCDETLKQIDKQFETCQKVIYTELSQPTIQLISDHMNQKIKVAIQKAEQDVRNATESAYKEALSLYANDKIQTINNVCHFDKWHDTLNSCQQ